MKASVARLCARLLRCATLFALAAPASAQTSPPVTIDYSEDGRLIDVRTVDQLHAIRWDLNGDGQA